MNGSAWKIIRQQARKDLNITAPERLRSITTVLDLIWLIAAEKQIGYLQARIEAYKLIEEA